MDKTYYDFTTKMEQADVNDDYIQGWQMGYLDMPEREEQRVNEAWEAGLEDGKNKNMENYTNWTWSSFQSCKKGDLMVAFFIAIKI